MSTYATPVPGVAGYAGADALATKAYNNAMARYNQQRTNTLLKYGVNKGTDGSYQLDPNNEYGSFHQMFQNQAAQDEAQQRQQAASGWGGDSGYLANARDKLSYQRGGEQAAMGQALQGDIFNIDQGIQDAAYQRDAALYEATQAAAQDAINKQNFNPGDYSQVDQGVDYGQQPAPAPAAKAAKPATHVVARRALVQKRAANRKAVRR